MRIIARRTLKVFWDDHPNARAPLTLWYARVARAVWAGPQDVKELFGTTVDFVSDNRIIFDVGGNKFRIVVHVSYDYGRVLIKFVGSHRDYDRIDPETV